jgi:thiazole synthase
MPGGSPIGSGQGVLNLQKMKIILEKVNGRVPVVLDSGIRLPSEAAQVMEIGVDACLINTTIAQAEHPAQMAYAMKLAVECGRTAYLSNPMPIKVYASASSPLTGIST